MRRLATPLLLLSLALSAGLGTGLSGCGFQLRGSWAMPYESLFLDLPQQSELGAQLKRTIQGAQATRLTGKADDAEATFKPTGENRERKVITYSSSGRVREVQLTYRYAFRIVSRQGIDLIAPASVVTSRDMTYDEANALAKASEEDLLWRDMMNDLTQQIMRLLAGTPRNRLLGPGVSPPPVGAAAEPSLLHFK